MIAVLGALQAEMYRTRLRMEQAERFHWAGREITQGVLAAKSVVCTWTGAGIAHSALTTQHICTTYRPKMILFGGIGAALDPMYQLGDIVIAADVIQWDLDTSEVGGGIGVFPGYAKKGARERELPTHLALRKRMEAHCQGRTERVFTGRFLSGDRVIPIKNGGEERAMLRKSLDGDVADMESSSIVLAGKFNDIPVVLLRIVSDTVSGERPANIRSFIDRASKTIADVFESFLNQ